VNAISRQRSAFSDIIGIPLIEFLALTFLLFQVTSLIIPFGIFLDFEEVSLVSIYNLIIVLAYVVYRYRLFLTLLQNYLFQILIFQILILPVIFIIIQYSFGIYDIVRATYWLAYSVNAGLLFCTAFIVGFRVGRHNIAVFSLFSLGIISFAFLINKLNITFIFECLSFSKSVLSGVSYLDRFVGFYAHPNEAGVSIVMVYILISSTVRSRPLVLTCLFISVLLIILTGSRTSTIAIVLWSIFISIIRFGFLSSTIRSVFVSMVGVMFAVSALPIITAVGGSNQMFERFENLATLISGDSDGVSEIDGSASIRLRVISQYIALIEDNPVLGVGYDRIANMRASSTLEQVSQISWLQWAAEYGLVFTLLYAVFFVLAFRTVVWGHQIGRVSKADRSRMAFFMVILLIYSFSLVDLLNIRSVTLVFGLTMGGLMSASNERSARKRIHLARVPAYN
jgi:hypothetical protein